jgi:hypothetical protein
MGKKINFIYGSYKTEIELETAITALEIANFKRNEISVLCPDQDRSAHYIVKNTKAPEIALIGATIGGLIGGIWGWTSGLSIAGISVLSNTTLITSPHPVLAGLAAMGCGAIIGGIFGGLIGYKMPEYELKNNENHLKEGRRLLSVLAKNEDRTEKAKDVLKATGAVNIESTDEPWSTFSYSTTGANGLKRNLNQENSSDLTM